MVLLITTVLCNIGCFECNLLLGAALSTVIDKCEESVRGPLVRFDQDRKACQA